MALRSLRRTLLRSTLACLGIIIGVAALITVVAVFNSGVAYGRKKFSSTQEKQISIRASPSRYSTIKEIQMRELLPDQRLSLSDYFSIRDEIPKISTISPVILLNQDVRANGRQANASGSGIDSTGLAVTGDGTRTIFLGSMFSAEDVARSASVCLITQALAEEIFQGNMPVGQYLLIGKTPFRIVGVVGSRQIAGESDKTDLEFFCPYTTIVARLNRQASFRIAMLVETVDDLLEVRTAVSALLAKRWPPRKSDVVITDITDVQNRNQEGRRLVTRILISVMSISLVVGGVGIMNIMYANVTERTREIGIRLAVGTRSRDIMHQFLLESVILSTFGGVIGIITGMGAAAALIYMFDWPFVLTASSVGLAFSCSISVGIIFGFMPAREAARLDPIVALRYE